MENYAVILGVDQYTSPNAPDLLSCENDAKLMEDFLTATGKYQILRLPNDVDSHTAVDKITKFLSQKESDIGEVLFYFSGHGYQDSNDMHYILKDTDTKMINSTALNNDEIDTIIRNVSPKLFVKLIDACQSGLSYIKGMEEPIPEDPNAFFKKGFENCVFIASSKKAQSSRSGYPYSPFTKAVIDAVDNAKTQCVKYSDLQNYLRDTFDHEHLEQTPYFTTQYDGKDVFCEKTQKVMEFLKEYNGATAITESKSGDATDADKIRAYLKKCREEHEVRRIMEGVIQVMGKEKLEDPLLNEFYAVSCDDTAPHINYSYREDFCILRTISRLAVDENLFVDVRYTEVEKEDPLGLMSSIGLWNTRRRKREPAEFISKATQMPEIRAYHLKAENENLPDYVIPFVFVYSPTSFYVFTSTKQFLRKGWNEYEQSRGTKYTYAKFDYAEFSKEKWSNYLKKRLSESVAYANETLLEYIG